MPCPTTLALRPATEADLPFLLTLRRLAMDPHLRRCGLPTDEAAHLARIRHHWDAACIVLRDGLPVGLFKVRETPPHWHLLQLQIHPDWQGQGFGEALLRGLLVRAQAQACEVSLNVLRGNPARRLYARLGFRPAGQDGPQLAMRWTPAA
ncbi:GNAT family N-acetyltransferase [Bordetella trematum]|uniref:GNAT family N-acetyltransferase n=1 Tax=Bordetella trematum TaxID=123899 RepID=UPI001404BEEA|nr:GNAT family N-acetyltransferase [Bordetella trematum]QIM72427.1 GNAT family N-acetyltransferase [Bordetella trematum]